MSNLNGQTVFIDTIGGTTSFDIDAGEFQRISIKNSDTSLGTVTITGGGVYPISGGAVGNGITLIAGASLTLSVTDMRMYYLNGITITTAADTTAEVIAQ